MFQHLQPRLRINGKRNSKGGRKKGREGREEREKRGAVRSGRRDRHMPTDLSHNNSWMQGCRRVIWPLCVCSSLILVSRPLS